MSRSNHRRRGEGIYLRLLFCSLFICWAGCPAPTPGERIEQLRGKVVSRGNGVVDLDLSGSRVTDADMTYINGFCSNDPTLKSVHTLNLSDTAITDKSLEFMAMQSGFITESGPKELVLTGTQVTSAAIEKYQLKAPKCKITK